MARSSPPVSFGGALAVTLPAATAAALLFSVLVELPFAAVWPYWPLPTLILIFYLRAVWYLCRGLPVRHRLGLRHLVAHALAFIGALALFIGAFFIEILATQFYSASTDWLLSSGSLVFLSGAVLAAYTVAVLTYYLAHQREATQQLEAEMLKRQIFASRAQLKNLETTIQPHFLFNTLNLIRPLITRKPERAQAVIDHLAGFLQYTLRHLRMEWVSLAEEIEHAEHYLALERLRLGERIEIAASYPEESQDLAVPSLVLLPLLENAVKHGFGTVTETGLLEIRISIEDRFLRILVRNPFDATVPGRTGGEGLGLSVLQQRLIGLYRRPVGMKTESADHHFQIVLELPKMRRNDVGPDLSGR